VEKAFDGAGIFFIAQLNADDVLSSLPPVESELEHPAYFVLDINTGADCSRSCHDRVNEVLDDRCTNVDDLGASVGIPMRLASVPNEGNEGGGEPPVKCTRRERRDGQRFDMAIKGRVVVLERLVVGEVSWPSPVVSRYDETWARTFPADTRSRLDVFGRGLRLPNRAHQAKSPDVDSYRNHARREEHVNGQSLDPLSDRLSVGADRWGGESLAKLVEDIRDVS
jgi:hypothetical protein